MSATTFDEDEYEVLRREGAYVLLRENGPGGPYERTFWTSEQLAPAAVYMVHVSVALAVGQGRVAVVSPGECCDLPAAWLRLGETKEAAAGRAAAAAGWSSDGATFRKVIDRIERDNAVASQAIRRVVFVAGPGSPGDDLIRLAVEPGSYCSPLVHEAAATAAWREASASAGSVRGGG